MPGNDYTCRFTARYAVGASKSANNQAICRRIVKRAKENTERVSGSILLPEEFISGNLKSVPTRFEASRVQSEVSVTVRRLSWATSDVLITLFLCFPPAYNENMFKSNCSLRDR